MILIIHIAIALITLAGSGANLIRPVAKIVAATKIGMLTTLISGVVVAVTGPVSLGHLCVSGVLFTAFSAYSVKFASRQLAKAPAYARINRR